MTIDRGIPSLLTVAFDELPGGVTLALVHKPHTSRSKVPNGEKTMVMVPEPPEETRYRISGPELRPCSANNARSDNMLDSIGLSGRSKGREKLDARERASLEGRAPQQGNNQ